MSVRLAAILLLTHLLYFFVLPSIAAKGVSIFGGLVVLGIVAVAAASPRFAARLKDELREIGGPGEIAMAAWFVLPLLSLVTQPTVAFWRLDGRALLIVAWLAGVGCSLVARRFAAPELTVPPHGRLPLLTQLLILWSTAFWLMLVWDVGVGRAVAHVSREDPLTLSFALWETHPVRDHLFLAWTSRQAFDNGVAYTNHLHPILFFFYGCSKLVQLATGLPLFVGRNLTPFATAAVGVLAFTSLVPRTATSVRTLSFHATLFIALGVFLTHWHTWVYPYAWGFDTVFPFIAYFAVIVWASAQPRVSLRNRGRLLAALVLFAAFGWLYTPLVVAEVWILFGRARPRWRAFLLANRPLVRASVAALAMGIVVYGLPLLLVVWRGYTNTSSSLLFRSGLDGDVRYFQDAAQAMIHPFRPARTWWSIIFPAFIPITAAAAFAWFGGALRRRRLARQSVFLLAPYFFSLAFFPQSVSIHPNLYDMLLIVPVVLIGCTWALSRFFQRRLHGPFLLAMLLLSAVVIMANLTAIAQRILPIAGR
jgi:hypothetical protein